VCSHAACAFYELHELERGKEKIEVVVKIRENLLPQNDLERANAVNNHGLLMLSEYQYDRALLMFKDAGRTRSKVGEAAVGYMACPYRNDVLADGRSSAR
jgi:hypothetical protein